jgi:hypothetical protein
MLACAVGRNKAYSFLVADSSPVAARVTLIQCRYVLFVVWTP